MDLTRIELMLDADDLRDVEEVVALRKEHMPLPDSESNMAGTVIAEICRGYRNLLNAGQAKQTDEPITTAKAQGRFSRDELQEICRRADEFVSPGISPVWISAYLQLRDAADRLDAMTARATLTVPENDSE